MATTTIATQPYIHSANTASAGSPGGHHHHLQRDTAIGAVLNEHAAVDETLVNATLLVARVHDIAGAGGLLEEADLVLALAGVVVGHGVGHALERRVTLGVVDLESAEGVVSLCPLCGGSLVLRIWSDGRGDILGGEIKGDGNVLPCVLENGGGPDLLVVAVQHLVGVRTEALLADDGAGLEVELVGIVWFIY